MLKPFILAAALQLAQTTSPDGLIHLSCTLPPDDKYPAITTGIIINPSQKTAWIDRTCGGGTTGAVSPAYIDQGLIAFRVPCKGAEGTPTWLGFSIDRYTGAFTETMQGMSLSFSGQCIAGVKQLF